MDSDFDATKRTARLAGLLYLVSSLPAPFALIYVPSKVFVAGDPAATAERLRTYSDLVRAGIAASLASGLLFIFVPLVVTSGLLVHMFGVGLPIALATRRASART